MITAIKKLFSNIKYGNIKKLLLNAKFGDKFITRNGCEAIFLFKMKSCNNDTEYFYNFVVNKFYQDITPDNYQKYGQCPVMETIVVSDNGLCSGNSNDLNDNDIIDKYIIPYKKPGLHEMQTCLQKEFGEVILDKNAKKYNNLLVSAFEKGFKLGYNKKRNS